MKLWSKITALFLKRKLEADMAEEMRLHLERRMEENIASGLSPQDARYAALRNFGGVDQVKELVREQRGFLWLEQLGQDLRQTFRSFRKRSAFAAAVILTLAVGVALAVVQLSFVNGALWGGPASQHQLRGIMAVSGVNARGDDGYPLLQRDYVEWKQSQTSFAQGAAFTRMDLTVSADTLHPREYRAATLEAGIFSLLRIQPFLGRVILPDDERADAPTVLLLGYRSWQKDFLGDPNILGRTARVNGEAVTIIGVMPDAFRFPANQEAWTNLRVSRPLSPQEESARVHVIGRLIDGRGTAAATAELDSLLRQFNQRNPSDARNYVSVRVELFSHTLIDGGARTLLFTLLFMVLGIVVLAAVNVANLLFARAVGQRSDIAIRAALGASRGRLVRQSLAEGLVFAVLGFATGLLLAIWCGALLNRQLALDSTLPAWFALEFDGRVLVATFAQALAMGAFCSLIPTLRVTRVTQAAKLQDAIGGASGVAIGRVNRALVVLQIALSCALLIPAGMLVKGIERSSRFAVPYDPAHVLTARINLQQPSAQTAARDQFRRSLLERLRALPGVEAVALSDRNPAANGLGLPLDLDGVTSPNPSGAPWGIREAVSSDYFHVMRTPVREGRTFTDADGANSERVAVVNESFARRYWPNESALGRQIRANSLDGRAEAWSTVVGVVRDLPMQGARSTRSPAGFYVPLSQAALSRETLLLGVRGEAALLVKPLQEAMSAFAPQVPVNAIQTVAASVQEQLSTPRAIGGLAFLFGICALGLSTIGIYGLTAYAVHRRTREFGIRVALGATRRNVLALVLRGGVVQLSVGIAGGSFLGWVFTRPLSGALSAKLVATGPEIYAVVGSVIAGVVAVALWIPARRATKADPMQALRAE
jgi:putative ABC transport system permease protein